MIWEIVITVDENDADYMTEISTVTDEELEYIKPLIEEIAKQPEKSHNYPMGEYTHGPDGFEKYPQFNEDIHQAFLELCPYGEHGFHTVKSIQIQPYQEKITLL